MLSTLGWILFAVGLLASVALHEIGHMVPAKRFGVKVTQYMVGFGPTVWSRKRGDTEYGIKGIPLGGYIRMIGMVPPRQDGKVSRWPTRMATAVEEFRQASRSEVQPEDEERQFYRLTPGKKMIVMMGGPTMNLVIYLVLTVVLLTALGKPHNDPTTTVQSVIKCVVPVTAPEAKDSDCAVPNSPALAGGLLPGDKLVAINGTKLKSWDAATTIIEDSPGKALTFTVERAGALKTLSITPVKNLKYVSGSTTKTHEAGFIGVEPDQPEYYKTVAVGSLPGEVGSQIRQGWDRLMQYPQKIGGLFGTVFEGKKRDVNGAVGVVGIGRISADIIGDKNLGTQDKIYFFVSLLASLNLLLFFFNLLPLLPLDGGHVAGAIVEAARRGRARLALRRNPHPVGPDGVPIDGDKARRQIFVDTAQLLPVMYVVGSLILVLTLLTVYADIVHPINLSSG
jgi:membrane-associated protease RseP (regulator of RpoE activity)